MELDDFDGHSDQEALHQHGERKTRVLNIHKQSLANTTAIQSLRTRETSSQVNRHGGF